MLTKDFCNAVFALHGLYLRVTNIEFQNNKYIIELNSIKVPSFYLVINTKRHSFRFYEDKSCKKEPLVRQGAKIPYQPDSRAYLEYITSSYQKSFEIVVETIAKRMYFESKGTFRRLKIQSEGLNKIPNQEH